MRRLLEKRSFLVPLYADHVDAASPQGQKFQRISEVPSASIVDDALKDPLAPLNNDPEGPGLSVVCV